jgi:hypothetical protein
MLRARNKDEDEVFIVDYARSLEPEPKGVTCERLEPINFV